jgi:hypothetical protein
VLPTRSGTFKKFPAAALAAVLLKIVISGRQEFKQIWEEIGIPTV